MHSVVTSTLNGWFRQVAEQLTDWENWRTEAGHEASLTSKRLGFEICDTFVGQAYLAVVQRDPAAVAGELQSCFQTDCLRRVATESLIPWLMQKWQKCRRAPSSAATVAAAKVDASAEELRDQPEIFDDFLEMTMQFMYVTVGSSCFPLAPAIALASNLIEVRSDAFKYANLVRRRRPTAASDTEPWTSLMQSACYAAVLTNTYMLHHGTGLLQRWLPEAEHPESVVFAAQAAFLAAVAAVERSVRETHPDDEQILRYRIEQRAAPAVTPLQRSGAAPVPLGAPLGVAAGRGATAPSDTAPSGRSGWV